MSVRTVRPAAQALRIAAADDDGAAWDRFVRSADGATACHLHGWRSVMEDGLGHECLYRVALDDDGRCHGVLPLVRVRSRIFGDYLVSMPFLNAGGPLGSPAARSLLAASAAETAQSVGADLLELRTRTAVPEDARLRTSHRKITVVLPLPDSEDALWKRFPSKLRSQVRRPLKEGMEARFGADQLEAFYDVFCRNMRDLGTPVLPRSFFERIGRSLAGEVVFCVVYLRETPVAAGCGFVWDREFEITWASAIREYSRMAPNMLLYWSFMREMIHRGVETFDFGRCTPGGGTHRFKRQWGGEDVPLPWAQWSAAGVAATPTPDRPLYRIATSAWQRLPLGIANRVGPVLARRIP